MWRLLLVLLSMSCLSIVHAQDEAGVAESTVFSGPQADEPLVPFKVIDVLGDKAGQSIDCFDASSEAPVMLVFVHQLTRPSIAVSRTLLTYAGSLQEKGLRTSMVFLGDDTTETTERVKRARHALPNTQVVIAEGGLEGPGAYGLNRDVTLTILVAKNNQVVHNYALVQPSVEVDVPRIAADLAAVVGADPPTREQLAIDGPGRMQMRDGAPAQDPAIRGLLAPVINKQATPEQVEQAVARAEAYFVEHPETAKQVGTIARRIIGAGVLERYGTPPARRALTRWAESLPKDEAGEEAAATDSSDTRSP